MKYVLGILIGLAMYPAIADVAELIDYKFNTELWIKVGVPGYGLTLGLTGRCNDTKRPAGVTNAEYFSCNKINIAITKALYGDE